MSIPTRAEIWQLLQADWVVAIAALDGIDLTNRGRAGESLTLGDPSTFHVRGKPTSSPPFIAFESSDPARQDLVGRWAANALEHVERSELGSTVWYSVSLPESKPIGTPRRFFDSLTTAALERTRIDGWRRLGRLALLKFEESAKDGTRPMDMFNVNARVEVHLPVPAPCHGFFSDREATMRLELVSTTAAFALRRPLDLPFAIKPTEQGRVPDLNQRLEDTSLLTLARRGVPLDVSPSLPADVFMKVSAALITIDAAMREEVDAVACLLLVAAAERIATPNAPWRLSRVTKRFSVFFEDLMPARLDEIIGHGNFEEVFGIHRSGRAQAKLRRLLVDAVYAYRSGHVHEGLGFSYRGLLDRSPLDMVRRWLFHDFAEGALLGFLTSPRSSLVGSEPKCATCNGAGVQQRQP